MVKVSVADWATNRWNVKRNYCNFDIKISSRDSLM